MNPDQRPPEPAQWSGPLSATYRLSPSKVRGKVRAMMGWGLLGMVLLGVPLICAERTPGVYWVPIFGLLIILFASWKVVQVVRLPDDLEISVYADGLEVRRSGEKVYFGWKQIKRIRYFDGLVIRLIYGGRVVIPDRLLGEPESEGGVRKKASLVAAIKRGMGYGSSLEDFHAGMEIRFGPLTISKKGFIRKGRYGSRIPVPWEEITAIYVDPGKALHVEKEGWPDPWSVSLSVLPRVPFLLTILEEVKKLTGAGWDFSTAPRRRKSSRVSKQVREWNPGETSGPEVSNS